MPTTIDEWIDKIWEAGGRKPIDSQGGLICCSSMKVFDDVPGQYRDLDELQSDRCAGNAMV
jgi:hypothetical protein